MKSDSDLHVKLPFGAPPVLPDVTKQLQGYLLNPGELPIHDYESAQQHWTSTSNPVALYNYDVSVPETTLKINRNLVSGELFSYSEVQLNDGKFEEWKSNKTELNDIMNILENVDSQFDLIKELRQTPPIISKGFDFNNADLGDSFLKPNTKVVNLVNLLRADQDILNLPDESFNGEPDKPGEPDKVLEPKTQEKNSVESLADTEFLSAISEDIIFRAPIINLSKVVPSKGQTSTEWAEILDITQPIKDFHERIPDMAFKYNFELDIFQKQAILKLEENCSVLVSAHTSAGKTVVAEYAIALSQRHMTRTVYTSPIKALSNQKYGDFRKTFRDVGLITGDFQINQNGCCLVMTTEILRAMLLAQNEIILDLEYVIFDEIHYINNSNRGHVWEEVLILLPPHVKIVMLSATIPNTLQFADWVGRTKRKKIYVVYTLQRPVPLEHYLYTGTGGSTRDERFLILSANNEFQKKGYLEAVEARKRKEAKLKAAKKVATPMGSKQKTTMWLALLEHLEKNDKLPVVAFTLSRKRCDENAEYMSSTNFLTLKEKYHVRYFFNQSIRRLKESDQNLPQIRRMQMFLENGIGIHHSGILPILKEIVEILFQDRCIKILFATETFAIGVNMPAKTVVFDSIKKFDGSEFRVLLPSEYIQMAGRAGRRGLDKTGTVLIICKDDIPSENELMSMMLGLPKKVESQFILTYSIILNLERKRVAAEGIITVEKMMSNSFKEVDHTKKKNVYIQNLSIIEKQLSEMKKSIQKSDAWEEICRICHTCLDYMEIWKEFSSKGFSDKQGVKYIVPGRIVLVTHKNHVNKLGILLSCDYKKYGKLKVLVLANKTGDEDELSFDIEADTYEREVMNDTWYKVVGLTRSEKIFIPDSIGEHVVLNVDPWDIMEITTLCVKTDTKLIINDWDNRQIPRFKENPPGQTCQKAIEELTKITQNAVKGDLELEFVSLVKGARITSDDHFGMITDLHRLKSNIESFVSDNILNFENQLKEVFRFLFLEKKRDNYKYLLSYKSMSLYPEYKSKLEVLRCLKYIDNNNSVQMKGNVACEMGKHELLITELVFRNALNNLQPAEIAALLSCFVYEGKRNSDPVESTANLEAGMKMIEEVAKEVYDIERECGVQEDSTGNEDNLNYELVPVVYEWARGKDFCQIMTLTDVQEGIIVRCIQQLGETIRDVKNAARIIGEPTLHQKMEDAYNAIKRDIVYMTSLYTE